MPYPLSIVVFGIAAIIIGALLGLIINRILDAVDARRERLERERDQAARELQETIMRIAAGLAQSQRDSTREAIRAAQAHSQYLSRKP